VTWVARLYVWATIRLYHELAWAYDLASWLVSLGRWSGWRAMALDYVEGSRILELGFGTGELLAEMAARGLDGVGLELSPAMHRVAARKLARRGWTVPRVQAGAQAAPFAAGQFDAVLSTFPSSYVLDPATLAEVARLLRPPPATGGGAGGRLVVVGLVVIWEQRLARRLIGMLFGGDGRALVGRLAALAREVGLAVEVEERGGRWVKVPVVVAERVDG
jgi:ubiquinone/menaquinone biosynthesis C-methylase UbiE